MLRILCCSPEKCKIDALRAASRKWYEQLYQQSDDFSTGRPSRAEPSREETFREETFREEPSRAEPLGNELAKIEPSTTVHLSNATTDQAYENSNKNNNINNNCHEPMNTEEPHSSPVKLPSSQPAHHTNGYSTKTGQNGIKTLAGDDPLISTNNDITKQSNKLRIKKKRLSKF